MTPVATPPTQQGTELSREAIQALDKLSGTHPGLRPAHARGILLSGVFTPAADGAALTRAPHLHRASTPVTVRFPNFAGVSSIPHNDPNASPRGVAIRFHLAKHAHIDIVAHSADGFPVRTAEESRRASARRGCERAGCREAVARRSVSRHASGRAQVRTGTPSRFR
jgi:catalase